MKKIEYKISIGAQKQKVWNTMVGHETYNEWIGAGWPGSFYKGRWAQGETIDFISADGSGTKAFIKELRQYDFIHSEHVASLLAGGIEDTTSDLAKSWVGTTEDYTLVESNGATELTVYIHAAPEWEKMFNDGFPAALNKLKVICEQ